MAPQCGLGGTLWPHSTFSLASRVPAGSPRATTVPDRQAPGGPMTAQTYPATPYLRRLRLANGWRAELIRDRHGEPTAIVAVCIGPTR